MYAFILFDSDVKFVYGIYKFYIFHMHDTITATL